METEGLSTFQANRTNLEAMASTVPEGGFSFQGDGRVLSAMALILLDESECIADKRERKGYIANSLIVYGFHFGWNLTDNQKKMLYSFAHLAVEWPQLLVR